MSHELKQAAFASLLLCMRPIARLLLRCGVTWKELAELCKIVYVEAAAADYGKHGRPANSSRVAILTGLSRREVKRIKDVIAQPQRRGFQSIERINHASRLLTGWYTDPDFLDRQGNPRLLSEGGDLGFDALLKRYAPGIPPTAMRKELKRVGAVRETAAGKLRAMTRYFMPGELDRDAMVRSGSVLHDIANTIAYNRLRAPDEPSRFERRATNFRVRRGLRRKFHEYLESHGMAFLEGADRWLSEHETKHSDDKTDRLGVGVYLIADD
jgi:hypothetical protein